MLTHFGLTSAHTIYVARRRLAYLLGQGVRQIRKTDESPTRIAVIDVVAAITGLSSNGIANSNAALAFARLKHDHPEVTAGCSDYKFPGRRQRNTPVTGVRGIVEIIMLMPGHQAARVRRQAADGLSIYPRSSNGYF